MKSLTGPISDILLSQKITFDVVWYLSGDWETDHRRQMITSFAAQIYPWGKILCVNRPVCLLISPLFKFKKFIKWLKGESVLKQITANLYTFTPLIFVHDQIALKLRIFALLNRKLLSVSLKRVIKNINFSGQYRFSWIYVPSQIDHLGVVDENEYIYECYDDYPEFKTVFMNRQEVINCDRRIARNALIVFNTAKKLYEEKIKINPKSFYIPNAVNVDLFASAAKQKSIIPDDLKSIPHPIIGFVGNVASNFFDYELIQYIISVNPSDSFVFLGNMQKTAEVKAFLKMPNVYYLGRKKYEELPAYMSWFDVGIIPSKINKSTASRNPLKLYEFMAAGCPVVATDIPEIRRFSHLISIAKDKKEFDFFIKEIVSSDCSNIKKHLLDEVKHHSWDERTKMMILHIKQSLGEKHLDYVLKD